MDEGHNKFITVTQRIAELNSLRELAEFTRDRLRILIASAKQSERLLRPSKASLGKQTRRGIQN
jgi:hypothetical protein